MKATIKQINVKFVFGLGGDQVSNKDSLITPQDFVDLKALVKNEMQRRANPKSSGSMAAYCNADYDYKELPTSSRFITDEHIQKITQPIDAATGSKKTPESHDAIYAEILD